MIPKETYHKRVVVYYVLVIIILVYRYFTHTLFHHFFAAKIFSLEADNTFWLIQFSGINQTLVNNLFLLYFLDSLLFLLPIFAIVYYNKTTVFSVLFSLLIFYYFIFVNTFSIHHFHLMVGVVFLSIVFCFKNKKSSEFSWQFNRYYYLFVMASAGLWKIARMPTWGANNMLHIFKLQHAQYLSEKGTTFFATIYINLLQYPFILDLLMYIGIGIELLFLVGFLTKKWDKWLFVIGLLFFIADYFLMNIAFFEILIFSIVLLPSLALQKETER